MERKCEDCKFWRKFEGKNGECHRYAPLPSKIEINTKEDKPRFLGSRWPLTNFDQWCGEFQKKQSD